MIIHDDKKEKEHDNGDKSNKNNVKLHIKSINITTKIDNTNRPNQINGKRKSKIPIFVKKLPKNTNNKQNDIKIDYSSTNKSSTSEKLKQISLPESESLKYGNLMHNTVNSHSDNTNTSKTKNKIK